MVADCIFCKIIHGDIPAKKIAQNDHVIVIQDIAPKAPVHYLVIPKKHIQDVASLGPEDIHLAGELFHMASHLAQNLSGSQAFRLITNNGSDAGQTVFHLHIHFLAGKQMGGF